MNWDIWNFAPSDNYITYMTNSSMTCQKCGTPIQSGTVINGLIVCDWCLPKKCCCNCHTGPESEFKYSTGSKPDCPSAECGCNDCYSRAVIKGDKK